MRELDERLGATCGSSNGIPGRAGRGTHSRRSVQPFVRTPEQRLGLDRLREARLIRSQFLPVVAPAEQAAATHENGHAVPAEHTHLVVQFDRHRPVAAQQAAAVE